MVSENDLAMEKMLDALLQAVQDEDEENRLAPAFAAEALAQTMLEHGMPAAALSWATIAQGLRDEGTSVAEFRSMTRRTLEKLSAEGTS